MVAKLLLGIEESCEVLGVKRSTLYQLIAAGEIESVKIGRARRIPAESLEMYVAQLRASAGA